MKPNPTQAEIRAELKRLESAARDISAHPALDDGPKPKPKPRAERGSPELDQQRAFLDAAKHYWWRDRVRVAVPERAGVKAGKRAQRQGQRRGEIDLRVYLPERLTAFIEFKAPYWRPVVAQWPGDAWWLAYGQALAETPDWEFSAIPKKSHGLTAEQALELWARHQDGHATFVAYSAEDALEWLSALCGEG